MWKSIPGPLTTWAALVGVHLLLVGHALWSELTVGFELASLHSGYVGDYAAWFMVGAAAFWTSPALPGRAS